MPPVHVLCATMIVLAIAASPCHAQLADRSGWGFSASIGASQVRDEDGSDRFKGSAFGASLETEFRFNTRFALGIGAYTLGKSDDDFGGVETSVEARGLGVFGRFITPMTETSEWYVRLGQAQTFVDIDPGTVSFEEALFGDDTVELGIGFDLARKKATAVRLEARFFNAGNDETAFLLTIGLNTIR